MNESMFCPTLEGTVYTGVNSNILNVMEYGVSSISLISSIQVTAFISKHVHDKWQSSNIDGKQ